MEPGTAQTPDGLAVTTPRPVSLVLTAEQLDLLISALDSHLYWQVSERNQRRDGYVIEDPQDENVDEIRAVRRLTHYLQRAAERQS